MSLALQHKRAMLAKKQKEASEKPTQAKPSTSKEVTLVELSESLEADVAAVRSIPDHSQRDDLKIELIEKYRKAANEIMETYQSWKGQMIVFWWLMWRLNTEGFEAIQAEMLKGVEKGLTTADNFNRDWQTIYLDELQNYIADAIKSEKEFDQAWLNDAIERIEKGEIKTNDPLKSKLYVHAGKTAFESGEMGKAKDAFEKALKFNEKAGVKGLLKKATDNLEVKNG